MLGTQKRTIILTTAYIEACLRPIYCNRVCVCAKTYSKHTYVRFIGSLALQVFADTFDLVPL